MQPGSPPAAGIRAGVLNPAARAHQHFQAALLHFVLQIATGKLMEIPHVAQSTFSLFGMFHFHDSHLQDDMRN